MSGESLEHVRLVERLIGIVQKNHTTGRGLMIFADHHDYGRDLPPQIGGFTPDLFAHDLPTSFRVVGEAKTPNDLESPRSLRQLRAFLVHLSLNENGTLYLAVPWYVVPRATHVLNRLKQSCQTTVVTSVIGCT